MNKAWRQRLDNANWPLIAGVSFFLTVLVVMALIYRSVVAWLMDEKQVPLRHVVVTGQLTHTTVEQITNKVKTRDLGSFFNVDVNAVQKRIESLPWVYAVSVRKKWPDSLNVHITEQHSAALWNEELLLNQQGQLFAAPLEQMPQGLPKLYGPKGSEAEALQGYRDLNGLLDINGFEVTQLKLSARFSWQLMLDNGVLLELGTDLRVKRVQRFIDMYEVISKHNPAAVVSVDLRYDTGMAVRWTDKTEGEKNS